MTVADATALTAVPTRHRSIKVLIAIQLAAVGSYVGGTLLPYLIQFGLADRTEFGSANPGAADILPTSFGADLFQLVINPVNWLVIGGGLVTISGLIIPLGLTVFGVGAASAHWKTMSGRLRGWLVASTVLCLALLAFQLTPLGTTLNTWVWD